MASPRALLALAVVASLLLAGCSGGPATTTGASPAPESNDGPTTGTDHEGATTNDGSTGTSDGSTRTTDDSTGTSDGTTTGGSAGVEPNASALAGVDVPSWLRADGVDAARLVAAHRASLDGESYRFETNQSASGLYALSQSTTGRVGADGARVYERTTTTTDGMNVSTRAYANETRVVLERTSGSATTYADYRLGDRPSPFAATDAVASYVRLGDFAVQRTYAVDGETRIEYVATSTRDVASADGVVDFSGRLVVSPDGRVHALSVNATEESAYGTVTTTFDYRLAAVGGVDASKPSWASTARDRATTADLAFAVDDGALVVAHEGGNVVPAGTEIVVRSPDASGAATVTLARDLSPGDTLYVARSGQGTLDVGYGTPPAADGAVAPPVEVTLYGPGDAVIATTTVSANATTGTANATAGTASALAAARRGR